jgi:hypothetical protein
MISNKPKKSVQSNNKSKMINSKDLNTIDWKPNDNIKKKVEKILVDSGQGNSIAYVSYEYRLQQLRELRLGKELPVFRTRPVKLPNLSYEQLKKNLLSENTPKQLIRLHFTITTPKITGADVSQKYNQIFDEICKTLNVAVINDENDFNAFVSDQIDYVKNNPAPSLGISQNYLYILLFISILDCHHDYKIGRFKGNNQTKIDKMKKILSKFIQKLNSEYNITDDEVLSESIIETLLNLPNSSTIEPSLNLFSYNLLKSTLSPPPSTSSSKKSKTIQAQPTYFYNSAKEFLSSQKPRIHYLISNAPSGLKYDEILQKPILFSESSTINNSCFGNQGTEIDGSNSGKCNSIRYMIENSNLFIELGNYDISISDDPNCTLRFYCKYFLHEDKLYSSLIVQRTVEFGKEYYAHYVYKIMDKTSPGSDTISVDSQMNSTKPSDFVFKYCPHFMGTMVTSKFKIENPYDDSTPNPFAELDVIHFYWKFLCDFLQSLLATVNPDILYRGKRYNPNGEHSVVVLHGDQPAEALHAILLYFSNTKNGTMNPYIHTCLSLVTFLKVTNIGGLLTYIVIPTQTNKKGSKQTYKKTYKKKGGKPVPKYVQKIPMKSLRPIEYTRNKRNTKNTRNTMFRKKYPNVKIKLVKSRKSNIKKDIKTTQIFYEIPSHAIPSHAILSDEMTTRCNNIFILLVDTERVYKLLNFEYDIETILDYNAFLVALFQKFIKDENFIKKYLPLDFKDIFENYLYINMDMLKFLESSDILQELQYYYMESINNKDNYEDDFDVIDYEDDFDVIDEFNVSSSLHTAVQGKG